MMIQISSNTLRRAQRTFSHAVVFLAGTFMGTCIADLYYPFPGTLLVLALLVMFVALSINQYNLFGDVPQMLRLTEERSRVMIDDRELRLKLDTIARSCLGEVRNCATDEQYAEAVKRIVDALYLACVDSRSLGHHEEKQVHGEEKD